MCSIFHSGIHLGSFGGGAYNSKFEEFVTRFSHRKQRVYTLVVFLWCQLELPPLVNVLKNKKIKK